MEAKTEAKNEALTTCSVCVESYSHRSPRVVCDFCDFKACRGCVQRFLCDRPGLDAVCMNCSKVWTTRILHSKLTATFLNGEYTDHLRTVLFQQEQALFPATMPYLETWVLKDKIKGLAEENKKKRDEIDDKYNVAYRELDMDEQEFIKYTEEWGVLEGRKKYVTHLRYRLTQAERDLNREDREDREGRQVPTKSTRKFTYRCGNGECKGFVNEKWVCLLCEVTTCKACLEVKEEEHKCIPAMLESAKVIHTQTRPCPNCGVRIQKISGCDQMYCTECDTAFSWTKGVIETGPIHNPHYYEVQRLQARRPQERGPRGCGGRHDVVAILTNMKKRSYDVVFYNWVMELWRMCMHHIAITLGQLRPRPINTLQLAREHRARFMTNKIDEKHYKTILYSAYKKGKKNAEFYDLVDMYANVTTDLVGQLAGEQISAEEFKLQYTQIEEYTRIEHQYLCKLYKSTGVKIFVEPA
jgi:hypothetical protein